jgi:hypothetical protein
MRENNKMNHNVPEQFQTGRTAPPKSYGGLIAFLLVLIIFLCGIVSILSLMNIRLFRIIQSQKSQDVSLQMRTCAPASPTEEPAATMAAEYGSFHPGLGIFGQEITPFYQQYYQIPQGIYISEISQDSHSYAQGLRPGDILIRFNDDPITDSDSLQLLLSKELHGATACLTVYREGNEHQFQVMIERTEGE